MPLLNWRMASSTSIGKSHLVSQTPCQDYHKCQILNLKSGEEVALMIASDGAGSAEFSDVGSRILCEEIFRLAQQSIEKADSLDDLKAEDIISWLNCGVGLIDEEAETKGHKKRDYACTFLFSAISDIYSIFAQIGDGGIVYYNGDDNWECAFWPQKGEFHNTTKFATEPSSLDSLNFMAKRSKILNACVFTDGIENLALRYEHQQPHNPFFDFIFTAIRNKPSGYLDNVSRDLNSYMMSERISERTDDDITLIMVSRTDETRDPNKGRDVNKKISSIKEEVIQDIPPSNESAEEMHVEVHSDDVGDLLNNVSATPEPEVKEEKPLFLNFMKSMFCKNKES